LEVPSLGKLAARRDERHAHLLEEVVAGQLHGEVAGESVGALDEDDADAIAGDAIEHGGEAGAHTSQRLLSRKAAATAGMSCGPMMPIVVTARLDLLDMAVLLS
jgi:hypothetical protein